MNRVRFGKAALAAVALSAIASTARAEPTEMFGFKPTVVAGVAFSGLHLDYTVKGTTAYASIRCIARAEQGEAKRIVVDFFLAGAPKQPAFAAAQSMRGIPASDTSDSYCGANAWPFADPHAALGGLRMKVTNVDTGEFTEVLLDPASMSAQSLPAPTYSSGEPGDQPPPAAEPAPAVQTKPSAEAAPTDQSTPAALMTPTQTDSTPGAAPAHAADAVALPPLTGGAQGSAPAAPPAGAGVAQTSGDGRRLVGAAAVGASTLAVRRGVQHRRWRAHRPGAAAAAPAPGRGARGHRRWRWQRVYQ